MKKFTFPLARVLDWRRTQVQIEESKLERIYAELRRIETRLRETREAIDQCGKALLAGGSVTGAELAALDNFRRAAAVECKKLTEAAAGARQRIAAQLKVVTQKRRDVKLLDLLHDRKLKDWNAELNREIDAEASELYLARLASRS